MRISPISAALLVVLGLAMPGASRASFLVGSTFTVSGTNFPNDFGPNAVTIDGTTQLIEGGLLSVTPTLIAGPGNSQWLDLNFQVVSGGSLASNHNSLFRIGQINGLHLTEPGNFGDAFIYFTNNNTALNSGLTPFSGFTVRTNPITPADGEVIGFVNFPPNPLPAPGLVITGVSAFASPFMALTNLGISSSTVNSMNGVHFDLLDLPAAQTAVPEPATLLSAGIAGVIGLGFALRRSRRANRAA